MNKPFRGTDSLLSSSAISALHPSLHRTQIDLRGGAHRGLQLVFSPQRLDATSGSNLNRSVRRGDLPHTDHRPCAECSLKVLTAVRSLKAYEAVVTLAMSAAPALGGELKTTLRVLEDLIESTGETVNTLSSNLENCKKNSFQLPHSQGSSMTSHSEPCTACSVATDVVNDSLRLALMGIQGTLRTLLMNTKGHDLKIHMDDFCSLYYTLTSVLSSVSVLRKRRSVYGASSSVLPTPGTAPSSMGVEFRETKAGRMLVFSPSKSPQPRRPLQGPICLTCRANASRACDLLHAFVAILVYGPMSEALLSDALAALDTLMMLVHASGKILPRAELKSTRGCTFREPKSFPTCHNCKHWTQTLQGVTRHAMAGVRFNMSVLNSVKGGWLATHGDALLSIHHELARVVQEAEAVVLLGISQGEDEVDPQVEFAEEGKGELFRSYSDIEAPMEESILAPSQSCSISPRRTTLSSPRRPTTVDTVGFTSNNGGAPKPIGKKEGSHWNVIKSSIKPSKKYAKIKKESSMTAEDGLISMTIESVVIAKKRELQAVMDYYGCYRRTVRRPTLSPDCTCQVEDVYEAVRQWIAQVDSHLDRLRTKTPQSTEQIVSCIHESCASPPEVPHVTAMLSNPNATIRPFHGGSHSLSGMEDWLLDLPCLAKAVGLECSERYISKLLKRAAWVMSRVAQQLRSHLEGHDDSPEWVETLIMRGASAQQIVQGILVGFVYTDEMRECDCIDAVHCDELKSESTQSAHDHRKSPAPSNTAAHGYNSSIFAVMNWVMRVSRDGSVTSEIRDVAQATLEKVFLPFITKLDSYLATLPSCRRVVFRGVTSRVARHYKLGSIVVWPSFSSTSLRGEVAKDFMAGKKGTYFIVRIHSGREIAYASAFPSEQEALLLSNTAFEVKSKMSPTLLRMLGFDADVVTMVEVGDCPTAMEAAEVVYESARQTLFLYHSFLEGYVEGRVASTPPPNRHEDTHGLYATIHKWIKFDYPSQYLVLLGSGGSGKTSATLACLSRLMTNEWTESNKKVVPVFVALPQVSGLLSVEKALDSHVADVLSIDSAGLDALASQYNIVLLLDSLDEADTDDHKWLDNLLGRNPWCRERPYRVLLSCRDEFLHIHGVNPYNVLLGGVHTTEVLYMQPFTEHDVNRFVQQHTEDTSVSARLKALPLTFSVYTNPFVLQMIIDVLLKSDPTTDHLLGSRYSIYERYMLMAITGSTSPSKADNEVEEKKDAVMTSLQKVALNMLSNREWCVSLGDVVDELAGDREVIRRVPCRVEDDEDDTSRFTFRHKSLAEFLCARGLWHDLEACLPLAGRPFSKDSPVILEFYREVSVADWSFATNHVLPILIEIVQATRTDVGSATLTNASNALAMLCAAGHLLVNPCYSLRDCHIIDCNLHSAKLFGADLENIKLEKCDLHNVALDGANINNAHFIHCGNGIPLPPLKAHLAEVTCLCLSHDATRIISGSRDKSLWIWDTDSGKPLLKLEGHKSDVTSVCIVADGSKIVSGSADKSIRVWDASSGKEISKLLGHQGIVTGVCVMLNGQRIVSSSQDRTVRIWEQGKEIQKFSGHLGDVLCICMKGDGGRVVSGSEDKMVRVWNCEKTWERTVSGKTTLKKRLSVSATFELFKLEGHTRSVTCVSMTVDGTRIISGSADRTIRVWDADLGTKLSTIEVHKEFVNSVCVTADSTKIISGSDDKTLRIFDMASGKELWKTDVGSSTTHVCSTSEGRRIFSTHSDKTVRVWDPTSGQKITKGEGHLDKVLSVHITVDGKRIVSGSADTTVRIWDADCGKQLRCLEAHTDWVNSVTTTTDGSKVISGSEDKTVRIWASASGKEILCLTGHNSYVNCVCVTNDGRRILSASSDKTVRVWDALTGQVITRLKGHRGAVHTVTVIPNSSRILSGSEDCTVRVWDMNSGEEIACEEGHTDAVTSVCITSDSMSVISASADHTLRVWSPHRKVRWGQLRDRLGASVSSLEQSDATSHRLEGHKLCVTSVCVALDGKTIVSGSIDKTVRVWNSNDSKELVKLEPSTRSINSVCITTDGGKIVTASDDGSIRILNITNDYRLERVIGLRVAFSAVGCKGKPRKAGALGEISPGLWHSLGQESMWQTQGQEWS